MRVFVLCFVASIIIAIAACGEDFKDCYGDDLVSCLCPSGAFGYAKCGPSGDFKSSVCVCDGTTPGVDAGKDSSPEDAALEASSSGGPCHREGGVDPDAGDAGCRK